MAADRPALVARVASVHVTVAPPPGPTERRRAALLSVASHRTIRNTLHRPPEVAAEPAVTSSPTSARPRLRSP
ncbi:hypothetical protein OG250_39680 [Streptomyces sp. NBC_00487]|uniref:hypothetical protein n=1 Tax=unclassified Streptomyces TaxID=2593676 RepID=UPI002E18D095|nr:MULTISPECIES: hypothetical protein [unclassified Streptomyces]